jgi:hypothetical protein
MADDLLSNIVFSGFLIILAGITLALQAGKKKKIVDLDGHVEIDLTNFFFFIVRL